MHASGGYSSNGLFHTTAFRKVDSLIAKMQIKLHSSDHEGYRS